MIMNKILYFAYYKKHWDIIIILSLDILLTVHLNIFISVFNQLEAQNFLSQ